MNHQMKNKIILFYVPCDLKKTAQNLAKKALHENLAACAQIFPVQSLYLWDNKVNDTSEYVLILKTLKSKVKPLKKLLESIHPYETPAILTTVMDVNKAYYQWMMESLENE